MNLKPINLDDPPRKKYEEYLASPLWRSRAERRLEIDHHTCQLCGCHGTQLNPLQCHHVSYRSIYQENIDKDLVTLCKACHTGVHTMMNRVTNSETGQRGWKDSLPYSVHVTSIDERHNEYKYTKGVENL